MNYKEVINMIKRGEEWYGDFIGIGVTKCGDLMIFEIDNETGKKNNLIVLSKEEKFKLKYENCSTTNEAMFALKKGKTIESLVTGNLYNKDVEEKQKLTIEEVVGNWYIHA